MKKPKYRKLNMDIPVHGRSHHEARVMERNRQIIHRRDVIFSSSQSQWLVRSTIVVVIIVILVFLQSKI